MRLAIIPKILVLCVCALAASGQDTRLSGPVPGFVFHSSSQAIRPIMGLPGSAHLGPAIAQGFEAASISPLRNSALATQSGSLYFLRGLDSGQPDSIAIEGAIQSIDRFAWSQDGLSAVVYSGGSRQAQIVRNLDPADRSKSPGVESAIDLSSLDAVSVLAFDGKRLAVGAGGVYLAGGLSGLKLLLRTANPVAFAFGAANHDLFVADQAANQIWMIADYAGDATPMLFADDRAGLSSPVAIGISRNGRLVLIANSGNRGSGSIDALEISTRASLRHIDLDFAPTRMEPVGSGSLALLNSGADREPLYLLDSSGDLAVYFVPAGSEE